MGSLKYHVLFNFTVHQTGGGSSFLSLVRDELRARGDYEEDPYRADVIFFNSHQNPVSVLRVRRKNKKAVFIQRVDGPMSIYNRPDDPRDQVVKRMGLAVADAIVFQSNWSREQSVQLKLVPDLPHVVIPNAPHPELFAPRARHLSPGMKVNLVGSNWSPHINKGFASYEWIDEHLDFDQYTVTLIGKVPRTYKNIRVLAPMSKRDLRDHLDRADIFLMPSRFEACSNALVEALHLGLPVLAYAGSSNVELVKNQMMLYRKEDEIPAKLEAIVSAYDSLAGRCELPLLAEVVSQYQQFVGTISRKPNEGKLALWLQEWTYRMRRLA